MIKFTIANGKIALDTNIVLFRELKDLYEEKDGQKYLQVIYYTHSTDSENPFRDIEKIVAEENILRTVFNKSTWKEIKMSKDMEKKYLEAEKLFIKYNETPETRLLKAVDMKLDEISFMLNNNKPVIEESITNSGETKFNTNLTIILNAFSKIETIMKSKTILNNAIRKSEGDGKIKGGGTTSFRERGVLNNK